MLNDAATLILSDAQHLLGHLVADQEVKGAEELCGQLLNRKFG
jgi:hypothetical protein